MIIFSNQTISMGLGLATEWIEISHGQPETQPLLRLGLATEWIEIITFVYSKMFSLVSVLRPSGLKYRCGLKLFVRIRVSVLRPSGLKCLSQRSLNFSFCLGLATEWIEMIPSTKPLLVYCVSVLRPSGLKYINGKYLCDSCSLGLATEWIEI